MSVIVWIAFIFAVGLLITLIVRSWRDRQKRNADGSGTVFLCDSGSDYCGDGGGGGD